MSQEAPFRLIDGPNRYQLAHAYLYAHDAESPHTIKVVAAWGATYELRIYALAHEDNSGDWHRFEAQVISSCIKDEEGTKFKHLWLEARGHFDTKRRKGDLKFL
jgi:hypothetical protein